MSQTFKHQLNYKAIKYFLPINNIKKSQKITTLVKSYLNNSLNVIKSNSGFLQASNLFKNKVHYPFTSMKQK